ncbi:erythroblast NAD(P)(+)--arginine ADP-ribosyltransferase-like [Oenanthe melanoleuca]|uniref:erythroblast NAD(P)(+)--arginine ADP-ribosyltransferase-like n=1 Tax=Oenanthe melanoleuca TaxID=2939378 RepID=UPI0024C19640|nr:erythroblast NAD(P)(+)--arginine ADP-ribosyltransferase-like [Oenanthe melanoleuca]
MALLVLTLALLGTTVATTAYKKTLDMAPNSFDDQYQGCGPEMRAKLPALIRSEFQKNPLFAKGWQNAVKEWQRRGSRVSPLSSSDQAIAIMAYTMNDLYKQFNKKVRVAGRYRWVYRRRFHFKTLHFLLTDALTTLRVKQGQKCHCVFRGTDKYLFAAKRGDIVRFGQFASASLSECVAKKFGNTTVFKVKTCHGANIMAFSKFPKEEEVLIPPFEKFNVTKVIKEGKKVEIHLDSMGTYSKYNCLWVKGGDSLGLWGHPLGLWGHP